MVLLLTALASADDSAERKAAKAAKARQKTTKTKKKTRSQSVQPERPAPRKEWSSKLIAKEKARLSKDMKDDQHEIELLRRQLELMEQQERFERQRILGFTSDGRGYG